ncbi:hypothetical protein [Acetobacter sp. P5B1]|uniref:hypothetical protein n=1 Tax=Acetobacter sp. P5B1 TaxID=2762620 RepID=UPI001C043728|nr:hypothetical protein [Acetobacter sp. P5B1]
MPVFPDELVAGHRFALVCEASPLPVLVRGFDGIASCLTGRGFIGEWAITAALADCGFETAQTDDGLLYTLARPRLDKALLGAAIFYPNGIPTAGWKQRRHLAHLGWDIRPKAISRCRHQIRALNRAAQRQTTRSHAEILATDLAQDLIENGDAT